MIKSDFLSEIKYAGLTSRLKRLSDLLLYSTKDFYKSKGVDIEPNWHLIFLLLKEYNALNITELSDRLQLSHPAIIKIVNNMKQKGYLVAKTDDIDSRKQILTLSAKAHDALPLFEEYWEACIQTMREVLEDNPEFLNALGSIEQKFRESSYKERTLKNLKTKRHHD